MIKHREKYCISSTHNFCKVRWEGRRARIQCCSVCMLLKKSNMHILGLESRSYHFRQIDKYSVCAPACMLICFIPLTLWDSMDPSPPGSSLMGFSRPEHWSGFPCPPAGDLPDPGMEPESLMSPALADGFFSVTSKTWEGQYFLY